MDVTWTWSQCVFRNLPSPALHSEGDALAIISDDLVYSGPASANVRGCQFLYIGQGIHARYAYVLVENCYFIGKYGDNDDVELFGEPAYYGLPVPIVRNNLFDTPAYDDRIHPTKCSAIICNNTINGSTDHAIVLRDKCSPVVFNNVIHGCPNGGISIQNQCDALLINNTIVNCGPGIKMFDHTDRWGLPYCLNPGSGRATVVNCIVWNNTAGWDLAESPYTNDHGSHLTILYSNVQSNGNRSASSTLAWGPGTFSLTPQFTNASEFDLRLISSSPCIDSGTNDGSFVSTNLLGVVTNRLSTCVREDIAGLPRPLDGNDDTLCAIDRGAYEFLAPQADSNQDGVPDGWTWGFGLSPIFPGIAGGDPDGDGFTTSQEYIADTDPTNAFSRFQIQNFEFVNGTQNVSVSSSSKRVYTLLTSTNVSAAVGAWQVVAGQEMIPGSGRLMNLASTNANPKAFYRVKVAVP